MFFSPNPITKRYTQADQLFKYLPQMEHSQSQKQHALYTNFSTVQQISKAIDFEKQRLDQENTVFAQRLNQCGNLLHKGKRDITDLKYKIQSMKFGQYQNQGISTGLEELPKIPLESIFFQSKEKPKSSSLSVHKDKMSILLSDIQKLQKCSAKIYLEENQNFHELQEELMKEFDNFSSKLIKEKNVKTSQYAFLQMKIAGQHQKIQNRIKRWMSQLNHEFEDKLLKLIDKLENAN